MIDINKVDFFSEKSLNNKVYYIDAENGEGKIIVSKVFEGIVISFNNFNAFEIYSNYKTNDKLICLDYCKEGRIEQTLENNKRIYTSKGDLKIDNRNNHKGYFYFPLKNYYGITICINVEKAEKTIKKVFPEFPVSINEIYNKLFLKKTVLFIRNNLELEQIFSQLYNVPNGIKEYYIKLKILELILFLSTIELKEENENYKYFYKVQTEKIKKIHNLIINDLKKHYTLEQLANIYEISLTTMKTCFKTVYGESIFAFSKKYRLNKASLLLIETNMKISEISYEVGYETTSKFSAAFKKEFNLSPMNYRNLRKQKERC